MSDVLALPFDQYQRYRLVADLLAKMRGGGAPLEVLDVGGRTAVLREFLPGEHITLVDMEASDAPGLVLGDGSALPFADDAFDVVAAFDTLEHVPPARRQAFVAECARVARRWVVLCGPYQHERVAEAERLLQRFLKDKLGQEHRYLDEHRHNGLPDRAATEAQLRSLGARVESIGHANLDRWLVLQCLSMYMDYDAALRPLGHEFQRFYNRSLYASDHAEPVYRHAVIAAFDGAPIPSAAELLGAPHAPAGTLPPFFALTAELLGFDRERAAWHDERGKLRVQVAEARADLDGHRASVKDLCGALERERSGALATKEELERDLDGHRAKLAAVESDRDGARRVAADLTRERDGLAAHAGELEHRTAGQARMIADLEADLAGHRAALSNERAEVAAQKSALTGLYAELEAQRTRAEALDAELREVMSLASGLEKSLSDREVVYDQLKSQLSSRWRNFVRVFRPHR